MLASLRLPTMRPAHLDLNKVAQLSTGSDLMCFSLLLYEMMCGCVLLLGVAIFIYAAVDFTTFIC